MTAGAPELLADLADQVADVTRAAVDGLPLEVAEAIGAEVAQRMAASWGGSVVYVPVGASYKTTALHEAVWAEFTGDNHNDLARRHRISKAWVYQIVKRMRAADQARRQGALFSAPGHPSGVFGGGTSR